MPDPHWDSPDGRTHFVGDDCQPPHAPLAEEAVRVGPGQRNHTLSDGCVLSHVDQDDVDDATVEQAIADLRRARPRETLVTIRKADYDALKSVAEAATAVDTCTYTEVKCRDGNCHGRLHAAIRAAGRVSRVSDTISAKDEHGAIETSMPSENAVCAVCGGSVGLPHYTCRSGGTV